MYDRPETAGALDRLWANFRDAWPGAPADLARNGNPWSHWRHPELLLSQTCGLPYRACLHGTVQLVGAPVHCLPCPEGHYFSIIIVRADDKRTTLVEFAEARPAINDPLSQSGWAALDAKARDGGFHFSAPVITGSHAASAHAVANRIADIAAIDAVSWEYIKEFDGLKSVLKEIDHTRPTPALPYITTKAHDARKVFNTLRNAIQNLEDTDRDLLCLKGLVRIRAKDYLELPMPAPLSPVSSRTRSS
ncbi:MAG: PhnD/SsuA/transferrin family substrate-binding protein [Boseongicola sp. SB0662_bin_57]|nr:PhnD/SsuA/transferrin family substrate-binding protein [Boseongicola sp. SB0662_bin_57]